MPLFSFFRRLLPMELSGVFLKNILTTNVNVWYNNTVKAVLFHGNVRGNCAAEQYTFWR